MKALFLFLFLSPFILFALDDYEVSRDSLLAIGENEQLTDTARAEAYIQLSELYYFNNSDSMITICEEGFMLIKEKQLKSEGKIFEKLLDQEAQLINNAGLLYYSQGELDIAIEYWYEVLTIRERLNNKKGQADILNNIGNVELDLGEIEKSKSTFQKVLDLQSEIGDSAGIARSYNVLGYIERTGGNDSLALNWYQKSLGIRIRLNDELGVAVSRTNVGFIYKRNQNYEAAIEEYNTALKIYKKLNYHSGITAVHNNLANCYYELGLYSQGRNHAILGMKLAVESQSKEYLMYLNEILYKINAATGNYSEALENHEAFIEIRDTLNSEKNYKTLVNREMEYEFEKKEELAELERKRKMEVQKLQYENELFLSEERSFQFKLIAFIVSIGLLIVIILLFFIQRQLRLVRAQKLIIEKQNKTIEMEALRSQMNPHFLFNSLNSIKHFIIKNEQVIAADYLTKFARLIRLVLENSKQNLIPLESELECLTHYLDLERIRFKEKFDYHIDGDASLSILVPPLILQPFVENCIWHGILNKEEGKGEIRISIKEDDDAVVIDISDNGIGRKRAGEIVEKGNLKKKSMGLNITHSRLKALNKIMGLNSKIAFVDLYDDHNQALGTKVIIRIPYYE